ncbi:trypsin-like serine peptidase [Geodermatophilus sp. CPCC 205506]|uniref:trypsin-like serine peptidase n=1 Tax=Geodermatophilus sp. CPCC 205506 TaxID=2936596 RepID=UPI003EE8DD73
MSDVNLPEGNPGKDRRAAGTGGSTGAVPPSLGLDELANAAPIPATESMPADIAELLEPHSGVYVLSDDKPSLDFGSARVRAAADVWHVDATSGELRTTIPGLEQTELQLETAESARAEEAGTDSHRPAWMEQQFLPRLAPFRLSARETGSRAARLFLEPRAAEAERLAYPWCCVGRIITSSSLGTWVGSGVLVGPNLVLTAGHVAPWGGSNWSMEFVPALREGDANPRPFGSSFISQYRGYNRPRDVFGYDYVICQLYRPLGQALGWMGAQSWGNEDEYEARDYTSSGYPATFGGRPAVQFSVGIRDIDNDSPGKELETVEYTAGGWSGGPLWFFAGQSPTIVGVLSGAETDVLDPRRDVYAGYTAMIDLIKFGLDNWRL